MLNATTDNTKTAVLILLDAHAQSNMEELNEAKMKFADANLSGLIGQTSFYSDRCKVLQGRQDLLDVLKHAVENLLK